MVRVSLSLISDGDGTACVVTQEFSTIDTQSGADAESLVDEGAGIVAGFESHRDIPSGIAIGHVVGTQSLLPCGTKAIVKFWGRLSCNADVPSGETVALELKFVVVVVDRGDIQGIA